MWKLKLFIVVLILVAFVALGMVFSSQNQQPVTPNLLGVELGSISLGVCLFLTLIIGALLGYLVAAISSFKQRGAHALLARKLKRCEQELTQLRTAALR